MNRAHLLPDELFCTVNTPPSLSIHQQVLFVYCGPILRAGGVGKSEQRPFFPTHLGLRRAQRSSLSLRSGPALSDSSITKNLPRVQELHGYTVKNDQASLTRRTGVQAVSGGHARMLLCPLMQDLDWQAVLLLRVEHELSRPSTFLQRFCFVIFCKQIFPLVWERPNKKKSGLYKLRQD